MASIEHVNFGWLHAPPFPPACCHALMVRNRDRVALIEAGIGTHDIADPEGRIGKAAIDAAGFQFLPAVTALAQLESRSLNANSITDIVLTHGDPDHAGGLSDFPAAQVHLSAEEKENIDSGNPRYSPSQFQHRPQWVTYSKCDATFFGLPARRVQTALDVEILLVPLFGHTLGHCGVAVRDGDQWILHVGDAYYLREELVNSNHPVDQLATMRADNDAQRRHSLETLRCLHRDHQNSITMFGYHDTQELPANIPLLEFPS